MGPSQYLEQLRNAGWVIAAIPPKNIPSHMNRDLLEQVMVNRGYDAIEGIDPIEPVNEDEPVDFRDDVEADADVLKSAGWGTDEDYGYYDG